MVIRSTLFDTVWFVNVYPTWTSDTRHPCELAVSVCDVSVFKFDWVDADVCGKEKRDILHNMTILQATFGSFAQRELSVHISVMFLYLFDIHAGYCQTKTSKPTRMWGWGGIFGQMTDPEAVLLWGCNSDGRPCGKSLGASVKSFRPWGKTNRSQRNKEKREGEEREKMGEEGEGGGPFGKSSLSFPILTSAFHQLLLVFHLQLVFCSFRLTSSHPDIATTHFLSSFLSFYLDTTSSSSFGYCSFFSLFQFLAICREMRYIKNGKGQTIVRKTEMDTQKMD